MTTETTAQRREKARAELVRSLEKVTREVVEAEHVLSQKREEQITLRDQLLAAVGGVRKRRLADIPERVLAAARVVNEAPQPLTRADVATALNITGGNAGMRLTLAVNRNLIERAGRGLYRAIGREAGK